MLITFSGICDSEKAHFFCIDWLKPRHTAQWQISSKKSTVNNQGKKKKRTLKYIHRQTWRAVKYINGVSVPFMHWRTFHVSEDRPEQVLGNRICVCWSAISDLTAKGRKVQNRGRANRWTWKQLNWNHCTSPQKIQIHLQSVSPCAGSWFVNLRL